MRMLFQGVVASSKFVRRRMTMLSHSTTGVDLLDEVLSLTLRNILWLVKLSKHHLLLPPSILHGLVLFPE
jgi:hypothetical protein